jgi:hypothetical protein
MLSCAFCLKYVVIILCTKWYLFTYIFMCHRGDVRGFPGVQRFHAYSRLFCFASFRCGCRLEFPAQLRGIWVITEWSKILSDDFHSSYPYSAIREFKLRPPKIWFWRFAAQTPTFKHARTFMLFPPNLDFKEKLSRRKGMQILWILGSRRFSMSLKLRACNRNWEHKFKEKSFRAWHRRDYWVHYYISLHVMSRRLILGITSHSMCPSFYAWIDSITPIIPCAISSPHVPGDILSCLGRATTYEDSTL